MNDKLAIITGASSDIGQSLISQLNKLKINVLAIDFDQKFSGDVALDDENISFLSLDASPNSWLIVERSLNGRTVNYLIFAHENYHPAKKLKNIGYEEWKRSQFLNVDFPLFLTTNLMKNMVKSARVLFLFDQFFYTPVVGLGAYNSAKVSLEMIKQVLALESSSYLYASVVFDVLHEKFHSVLSSEYNEISIRQYFLDNYKDSTKKNINNLARFVSWALVKTSDESFSEQQWDFNDNEHLSAWRINKA